MEESEAENSKIYQKIISNAKNLGSRALSPSPKKHTFPVNQSLVKIKKEIEEHSAHKQITPKQVEETIHDIMETKQKKESVKGVKTNMESYLKMYFRNKFGMKDLAD